MTREKRAYLSFDRRSVVVAATLGVAVFAVSRYRRASYLSTTVDMAVFDREIWLLAHGKAPISTAIGRNIFADHFSPILVLFAPLYLIAATPL